MSFLTPLSLTEDNYDRIPRANIECLQDRAIPIGLQRQMVSRMPCERVSAINTDHSPFYSAPEELAAELLMLA
jgi:hypothetical protein